MEEGAWELGLRTCQCTALASFGRERVEGPWDPREQPPPARAVARAALEVCASSCLRQHCLRRCGGEELVVRDSAPADSTQRNLERGIRVME